MSENTREICYAIGIIVVLLLGIALANIGAGIWMR